MGFCFMTNGSGEHRQGDEPATSCSILRGVRKARSPRPRVGKGPDLAGDTWHLGGSGTRVLTQLQPQNHKHVVIYGGGSFSQHVPLSWSLGDSKAVSASSQNLVNDRLLKDKTPASFGSSLEPGSPQTWVVPGGVRRWGMGKKREEKEADMRCVPVMT